ncbi:SDR family oxidoreductase [Klebsiella pneumoniae]|uniref:SDR family oxidoreductase n=1 Tax=Klebsiella pneumoniae TaxID=573 RepID=A0A939NNQ2_KLEPN|nr:SDR family oxidoreductase [Klebsiella pneumoniae]
MTTLFITGVTGFLGGAALEKILHQETRLDLLLLVRADSPRLASNGLKKTCVSSTSPRRSWRCCASSISCWAISPLRSIFLTIRASIRSRTSSTAPLSLHLAATLIWKVNVEGTLRLAQRMAQVTGLQRFLHVGTAMSCSPEPDSLVAESAEFRERAEHTVEYTHSKSTIEQLMQQQCPTLPLVIARPLSWWVIPITAAGLPAVFSGCSAWG